MAPSPTGYFHVGSARTALFNWLFARQRGGTFVLRIEDTDAQRNRAEHTEGIERAMLWLGLDWDEGPYFQSERGALYEAAINQLLDQGLVYACDCTAEQVAQRNKAAGRPPGYDGYCRDRAPRARHWAPAALPHPDTGTTSWTDIVRGEVVYENASIEDFSVRKSNGQPLFILANVVDDGDMAITHVMRGEDHVPNTPKHILLWEALGLGAAPGFAHLPLLVNESRQKLSKRRDKVALEDYRDEGYLPEAMVNYLALLGWSPGGDREVLSRQELIDEFRLEDVKSSPAFFDQQKLSSVNAAYMRSLSPADWRSAPANGSRPAGRRSPRWSKNAPAPWPRSTAWSTSCTCPMSRIDQADWAKVRRQQPAFVALLEAAEAGFAACEWDADGIRDATLEAGQPSGSAPWARPRPPYAWPSPAAPWGRRCSSRWCCWADGAPSPAWRRPGQRAVREDQAPAPA